MRELKRSIARHLMEMHGVTQINKKNHWRPNKKGQSAFEQQNSGKKVSFFALHWKDYLNPDSLYRKDLEWKLKLKAARQSRVRGRDVQNPWPVPRAW